MKKLNLFSLIFLLAFGALNAQETLPKGLTSQEQAIISEFKFTQEKFTPAPSSPVRTAAEWEEIEYLVLAWDQSFANIQRQIVAAAIDECKVLIASQNPNSVKTYLQSHNIDLTNVEFLNAPANSIWIRDYAGNTVYTNDVGERALVDWIYNRPRPLDNQMPTAHANYLDIPIYITDTAPNDLVNTGGNFMTDGLGNAFASKLILQENQAGNPYNVSVKTEQQIDQIVKDYMGINSYRKMEVLPYDQIHHIDMHMKLLDEETILVSKYPQGVADGPQIEANINYITSTYQTPYGNPYEIKWIPAPPSPQGTYPNQGSSYRTYTNSVFINKTVLVPIYRPEVDAEALAIYQELLPGYRIIGIDVDNPGEDLISLSGAIHCITHGIGVDEPLWITHEKVRFAESNQNIPIEAQIKHISGIEQAKVFWRQTGTNEYFELNMSPSNGDLWQANLTVPMNSTSIEYYIWAKANSGKSISRPIVAPEGFWTIMIADMGTDEWASQQIQGPFPNPAKDVANFKIGDLKGEFKVSIYNMVGQELFQRKLSAQNGNLSLKLNPSWTGILMVKFQGEFGEVTKKLIKK